MSSRKLKFRNIKISDIIEYSAIWWKNHYRVVFIISMFISMLAGVYFWNLNLNNSIMTDQEKNEYRIIKDRSVQFAENEFKDAIKYINQRNSEYSNSGFVKRDIFK